MIGFDKNTKDDKLERKFYLAIYCIVFFSGLYAGMYCFRFGILVDVKHHLQAANHNPKAYFSLLKNNSENNFEDVALNIKFKNYIKLSNQRSRFVYSSKHFFGGQQWKNRSNTYVNSEIKYQGEKFKIKAKLFGKNNDHFRHPYKWSFRIKSKEYIHGFNNGRFNLLQPNTRQYVTDILCNEVFEKHGILNLNYKPINLTINNRPSDIYFVEDFFSKYLIEKSRHRDSYIFTFDAVKHPSFRKLNREQKDDIEFIKEDLINYPDKIMDINKFDTLIALLFIAQNKHPFLNDNLHFFYNSVTNSVEPIIREVWFESPLSLESEDDLKHQILNFINKLKGYNSNLEQYLNAIVGQNDRTDDLYEKVLVVANDINSIRSTQKWEDLERQIFTRFPQALYICKNIEINANQVLQFQSKIKLNPLSNIANSIISEDTVLVEDLMLTDENLVLHSGVSLDLNGNNIIINRGAINAVSDDGSNIHIINTSLKRSSSIIVKNAPDTCVIRNVNFKGLSHFNDSYWHLPASITFYESKVVIEHVNFDSNRDGDDFVNLFRCSYFLIDNTRFSSIKADAIDADFSTGVITNSTFNTVGNDAIDGSGSILTIINCEFNKVNDKVISAGEQSTITISNSKIENSSISFVSKDDSKLYEHNNILKNNKIDYSVFNKKEEFKHGSLYTDKTISKYNYIIEKRSKIYQNNQEVLNLKLVDSVKEIIYGTKQ